MFEKVLIANRGEIAVRVIRACRELGIKTVVIHPEIDQDSLHVTLADEKVCSNDRRVYLDINAIIEAAITTGAQAIHPGYGFLAENPNFALACENAGLTLIGPSSHSMRFMGEKTLARKIMLEAGVPVTPGSEVLADLEEAKIQSEKVGYPIMLKASAGGGGRGIRVVQTPEDLDKLFPEAQKEAQLAFNCPDMYIEKYLDRPRHIEIQVLADKLGNVIYLGERECSIQRRRQKLIEEAPSLAVTNYLRSQMGEIAVKAAKAVDYVGAGTVEFLLDQQGNFYFMEMNTRIQVEHPVTEMVTGIDLVKEQILIAFGEKLSVNQSEIEIKGWSIECRLIAEDTSRDFRPSPGTITLFNPPMGPWTRLDTHVYSGFKISPFYDSLIGKLIVWGRDRKEALARLERSLLELQVEGVKTNIYLCKQILSNAQFIEGDIHINLLEDLLSQKIIIGGIEDGRN
ncbi:MAG: acetyl-CoA carboxylase biotin carboxylase subunit [Desulfosporosinus sp. BRH_c37]|nr:MAG: acetyl-CoA carboxylase biotin carboxylase subunit [Desulfosporosinus sp. BRH_c37]